MQPEIRRAVGVLSAALAIAFAAPAVASAGTAAWNDAESGAALPAHEYVMPVGTSVKHDVSTDSFERDSLALPGDAESAALPSAMEWYEQNVAPIDRSTTYAVGDTDTKLVSDDPSTRIWSVWVVIYTVADPKLGYRYCESHYTTTARLTEGGWSNSSELAEKVACRSIPTWVPKAGAPFDLMTTAYTTPVKAMSKGNAGYQSLKAAGARWQANSPNLTDYGLGVNYSVQLDADTWYDIVTVYSPSARRYCIDGWTVDFNSPTSVTTKSSGSEYCADY